MRDVGIDQMEDEGRVEEHSGEKVGCTEVRHFRDCWECSTVVRWRLRDESRGNYRDIQTDLSFLADWSRKSMAQRQLVVVSGRNQESVGVKHCAGYKICCLSWFRDCAMMAQA